MTINSLFSTLSNIATLDVAQLNPDIITTTDSISAPTIQLESSGGVTYIGTRTVTGNANTIPELNSVVGKVSYQAVPITPQFAFQTLKLSCQQASADSLVLASISSQTLASVDGNGGFIIFSALGSAIEGNGLITFTVQNMGTPTTDANSEIVIVYQLM
jgi:hypothetical protein